LIGAHQFILDLFVDASRDKEVPRVRNSLKARCNVDTIAINVFGLNNYVAERTHSDPLCDGGDEGECG
jgi:hypothetical protein